VQVNQPAYAQDAQPAGEGVGVGTYQVVPPAKRAVTCGQIRLVCAALKLLYGQ
jgi:hypothetical protein